MISTLIFVVFTCAMWLCVTNVRGKYVQQIANNAPFGAILYVQYRL
jgi:hypothetical protein